MLSDEDFELFTRWRIRAFGQRLREICMDEGTDSLAFEEKAGMCIEAERTAREDRKMQKAARAACFKLPGACIEDIAYLPDRTLGRDRIARLASCAWIAANENLVILSESGGGKSYVAQALGNAACRKLIAVRYARLNDMFRELNVARSEGSLYDAIDAFSGPRLLILDDFLTTPIEDARNAIDLFEILERREGRGSTLIASQLEPDQWYLRIDSAVCADSILGRIVKSARFIDIKSPDMRQYMASKKAEGQEGCWE